MTYLITGAPGSSAVMSLASCCRVANGCWRWTILTTIMTQPSNAAALPVPVLYL